MKCKSNLKCAESRAECLSLNCSQKFKVWPWKCPFQET